MRYDVEFVKFGINLYLCRRLRKRGINNLYKITIMKRISILLCSILVAAGNLVAAETPAFPGAEGFARYTTTGGRGGAVYHVTKLTDDSSEGTLRWAIKKSGKRTIVFDVSGTIELQSNLTINNGDLTIAGQTAPGDGICIKNRTIQVSADNVIIRFIRFRLGTDKPDDDGTLDADAIWGRNRSNIIIDHCSMSWSTDECGSFYDNTNFTMQWCFLAESLRGSLHPKGNHGYGGIWGGHGASFHHNILAHNDSRNPRMCGSRFSNRPDLEKVDFRNNVIYNWGKTNSSYAGEGGTYNFVNNYYKPGAATAESIVARIFSPNADDGSNSQPQGVWGTFYVAGNYVDGTAPYSNVQEGASRIAATNNDNWNGIHINDNNGSATIDDIRSTTEYDFADVTTHTAATAFEKVVRYAGASYRRDAVDERVAGEITSGTYTYTGSVLGGLGIIDSPYDVGGWPVLISDVAPTDTDRDGIPDAWEIANGLDPEDATDGAAPWHDGSGYTALEVYMNSLVEDIMKAGYADAQSSVEETYPAYVDPNADVEVTTLEATDIKQREAVLNGTVVAEAGKVAACGFEYRAANETTYTAISLQGTTLTYQLTDLTPSTSYVYRAYAETVSGSIVYGTPVMFTTLAPGLGDSFFSSSMLDADGYYWFNTANDTQTQQYIADGTLVFADSDVSTTGYDPEKAGADAAGASGQGLTGCITVASRNRDVEGSEGGSLFVNIPDCGRFKIYTSTTGTRTFKLLKQAEDGSWSVVFTESGAKKGQAEYDFSEQLKSTEPVSIEIRNLGTGGLMIHGMSIYHTDSYSAVTPVWQEQATRIWLSGGILYAPEAAMLSVYDLTGSLLLQGSAHSLDVSSLARGIYVVRAVMPDGTVQAVKVVR